MTAQPADPPTVSEILARAAALADRERWAELVNAAAALHGVGRVADAREVLEPVVTQTRALVRSADDRDAAFALSAALVNLATVEIARGADIDLTQAAALLDEADGYATEQALHGRLGTIEINRARIASLRGQVAEARRALERAEAHYRREGSPSDLAWAKRALGASLAAAGQLDDALALQIEARDTFSAAGHDEQADATEVGVLAIRAQLGRPVAVDELIRLEQLSSRMPAEPALQLLGNLANLAMKDDLDAAERLWGHARDRSRREGRVVEEARADLALAGVARRRGQLEAALQQTLAAGARLDALGALQAAAHAEINAALLLGLLADRAPAADAGELRRQAVEHVARGVTTLDGLRHSLPTAAARRALLRGRYPQLFVAALEATLKAGQLDLTAALIERARMQPVLSPGRPGDGGYVEPPLLASRPGAAAVHGEPPQVDLTTVAERLAGPGAHWIGWWRTDADLLHTDVGPQHTHVRAAAFPDTARTQLDACLARVTPAETQIAGTDTALAGRLALYRAAAGPLLAERDLVRRLHGTLRPSIRAAAQTHSGRPAGRLDDVLWPLSRELLGERLLAELTDRASGRRKLVLAPPPQLADVPWPLLPLRSISHSSESPHSVPRLLDVADIVVGLPAALLARGAATAGAGPTLAILDPSGDLAYARRLDVQADRMGHGSGRQATPQAVRRALEQPVGLLVISAHVRPGLPDQPAAAALVLSDGHGGLDELTVGELAAGNAPPVCVILGCDGSGGGVGDEWTGLTTGLIWAGAAWVITTTWPTLEDRHTAASDAALVAALQRLGPREGLWAWQRDRLRAWRTTPDDPAFSPYRWAGMIVCGRGSGPV